MEKQKNEVKKSDKYVSYFINFLPLILTITFLLIILFSNLISLWV